MKNTLMIHATYEIQYARFPRSENAPLCCSLSPHSPLCAHPRVPRFSLRLASIAALRQHTALQARPLCRHITLNLITPNIPCSSRCAHKWVEHQPPDLRRRLPSCVGDLRLDRHPAPRGVLLRLPSRLLDLLLLLRGLRGECGGEGEVMMCQWPSE